ncbi:helix-turn-helix domain-containing protein [Clostridium beijerinckii]|uniref:Transcriptional regulator with XRE-family HTH domain n=1 Tax=Clostridium beijerinckii TaxID=1520 RepID=A0AAX0BAW5_CLOBE|nr:helix-turn-helix transcriptional regulator [Clostridium beijerinckii]NRT92353.1 transcriptional regulator with XRE-family HTH domain [Clostridium beijerinckii]NYC75504.1 transcriptional regulator with XRE-family HTH domain [Clostridium beijerinckii]
MIGLEYILNLYNMQHQELAEKLGIRKQNINLWIKRKQNLSKKHLPKLEEIFKIPQEYFEKELTDVDKLIIQKEKLKNELGDNANMLYQIKADWFGEYNNKPSFYEVPLYEEPIREKKIKINKAKIMEELNNSKHISSEGLELIRDVIFYLNNGNEDEKEIKAIKRILFNK